MTSLSTPARAYAGFWIRLVAFFLDNVALGIVLLPLSGMLMDSNIHLDYADPVHLRSQLLQVLGSAGVLSISALVAAIIIAFWIFRAATPGKMLFNAHIVDAKTFRPASNGRLVIRYIGYFISTFFFCLGFLWIAFDKRKQGWHDKLAGTVVIIGQPEHDAVGDD